MIHLPIKSGLFYEPTSEHLEKLGGSWCASYSGGKDSTSLVTWVEWLRRSGQISIAKPQLVQSDTMVEYPILQTISNDLMKALRKRGWECAIVVPRIKEKLYNRILGIGNTPIYPGIRSMRWCTRSTKIAPMERWRKTNSSGLTLTGLRMGESSIRDGKILKRAGCSAGGECGIPDPSEKTYSPILNWTICKVIDWLNGDVTTDVRKTMEDLYPFTRRLVEIYEVAVGEAGFGLNEPEVSAARFGCVGCPAISSDRNPPKSILVRNGPKSPLNELYDVWFEARRRDNRCIRYTDGKDGRGPIRMTVRKQLFSRVMDIQKRAGIVLVSKEDEAFIRQCWKDKVYPRGWSEADESVVLPVVKEGLFQ